MDTTRKITFWILLANIWFLTLMEANECERNTGIFFLSQPQDDTACVGGSATMSCEYNGTTDLPRWIINSVRYISSGLPFNTAYDGQELTVNMLNEDQNGTTYQCFFSVFDLQNGPCEVTSTIGSLTVLTPSICEQHEGPINITQIEGQFNVFIPCPQYNLDLPVWKINGYYYEFSQLPEIYKPDYGGIYIRIIKRELNGTTFQCYYTTPISNNNDYEKIAVASSIGVLIVNLTSNSPPVPVQNSRLYLDHANMSYAGHNLTLAWKPTILHGCSMYEIILRNECELESFIERRLNVSSRLNTAFLYDNVLSLNYMSIENINRESTCQWMNMTFRFSEYGTFNLEARASLSKLQARFISTATSSIFYLVLPREDPYEQDCFCPVIDNGITCFELDHCSCINHTNFIHSHLKLCRLDEFENFDTHILFIQTLREEMNNSNIYIFQGFYCNNGIFPIVREYTHSLKIMIVLPEPPSIFIHHDENRICVESEPVDGISVDHYNVIVRDVTEKRIFMTTIFTPNNCTSIRSTLLQDKNCAPYSVSVQAFNSQGSSDISVAVINGSQDTAELESCSCYIAKLGVMCSLDIEENLEVLCSADWHVQDIASYYIEVRINNSLIERSPAIGDYTFDSLDCKKEYNVSVSLEVHNYLECSLLVRNDVHLSCPEHTKTSFGLVATITTILIVLSVLIIFICIVIAIIACAISKKKGQKKKLQYKI